MTLKSPPSLLAALGTGPAADADLLARFVSGRDQAAFADLVRRYARLVWRVARTRCRADATAEDVFQATFVVLSRKASTVRTGSALAGWLHRTAHRLAVRAAKKERRAVPLPPNLPTSADPLDALTARELLAAVDDEMAKLSDAERSVLVLCGLDGLANDDAAKRLGVTPGAVKGRLERARAKLRGRLDARGLTLPAVVLGLIGTSPSASAVQAALAIPRGGAIPPGVEQLLTEGLNMKGMITKAALTLTLFGVVAAVGGWGGDGPPARRATAAPVPKDGKDDGLIWTHNPKTGTLSAYTPDGKKHQELTLKDRDRFHGLTPDGGRIVFAGKKGKLAADGDSAGLTLHLRDVSDKTDGADTGLSLKPGDAVHWSADGKQVVRVRWGPQDKAGGFTYEHALFDLATKKETKVGLPVNHYVIGWAADGKTWHLHEYVRADLRNPNLPRYRMMSVPAGGGNVSPLCDSASLNTFEPADGKAYHGVGNAHKNPEDATDATYRRWFRVSDGQATLVKTFDDLDHIDLRPSPDRKRVVVMGHTSSDESSDTELRLYDADGTNEQKLVTMKKTGPNTRLLGWFPKTPADARRKNAPVPKAEPREGVLLLSSFSEHHPLEVLKPDGETVTAAKPTAAFNPWLAKLSADGKRAAFAEPAADSGRGVNGWAKFQIRWLDLEAKEFDPKAIADEAYLPTVAWAADGNRVYGSHVDPEKLQAAPKQGQLLPFQTWVYDPATGKKTPVKLPPEHAVVGASPDGKTLLTRTTEFGNPKQVLYLTPVATLQPEKFGDAPVVGLDAPRFSPDGKRLLWARRSGVGNAAGTPGVYVTDVATKKETKLDLPKEVEASGVHHVCWSPDGKRIALYWYEQVPRPKNMPVPAGGAAPATVAAGRLTVCDADGANPKVTHKRDAEGGTITGLDWR